MAEVAETEFYKTVVMHAREDSLDPGRSFAMWL